MFAWAELPNRKAEARRATRPAVGAERDCERLTTEEP
jgi:hypothetical protein